MVPCRTELRPGIVERGSGFPVSFLSLVVLPYRGKTFSEQRLLALVGAGRLAERSLGGPHIGIGRSDARLLLLRVESGQHLVGVHVVADIDHSLGDAAFDPKSQIAFEPRANLARESHG